MSLADAASVRPTPPASSQKPTNIRWVVCALLFFAATINYIDRNVLAVLKLPLTQEFGWSNTEFGYINFFFQVAYMVGMLASGWLIDRIGTRRGLAIAICLWSVAAMLHAEAPIIGNAVQGAFGALGLSMAASVAGFAFCRVLLGIGEAAIFPGSVRSIAEWFPQKERALATGLFNAGTNIGALATPIIVPIVALRYGWYWAFLGTGAVGFIWLAVWLWQYRTPRTHPGVNGAELALIESDPPDGPGVKVPGLALAGIVAAVCFVSGTVAATFFGARLIAVLLFATGLITAIVLNPRRQVWAYAVGKFMTDPVWWLYLTWLPDFLVKAHHLDIRQSMLPLATIYLIADIGSVLGGYVSSKLMQRGYSVNHARKITMGIFAASVTPIVFAAQVDSLWAAVLLISIAASGHQAWSANLYTLVSDMFPRKAVGSVIGFGGMMGACGGAIMQIAVGVWLDASNNNYVPIFVAAGTLYLLALGVIHLLVPKMTPAVLDAPVATVQGGRA
ncbi:MAG TPA: MFS transporter [Luteitalea sp.]|nr:MFS transporter [Luteitalea sp.]